MVKPLMRSFAGGEITPELYGRIDLDKFQTGVARALNFRILPHGPAQNRAGFQFVNRARSHATNTAVRLIPFAWSVDQTMVLEFGHQYIRFHTNGATLLEAAQTCTSATGATPAVFTIAGHGWSNADWLYCVSPDTSYPLHARFFVLANATANTFTLADLWGTAIDGADLPALPAGTTFARVYQIASPYTSAELFDLHYTQSADVLTIAHPNHAVRELRRVAATNWSLTSASFVPGIAAPASTTATAGGSGGTPVDHFYKTTAISGSNFEESLPSPVSAAANIDLAVSGNYVDVTPAAVSGAVRFNVYKLGKGGLYGYIGQSDGTAFRDDNIIPDMTQTPPEASTPFNASGDYPSTTTYVEQRRAFAATDNRPQNVWMTRSATEGNLSQSIPTRDNDAIAFRIAANQQNRIRHLVPLGDLIALTAGGEFRIYSDGGGALTPANTTPKPQSYVGASNVQPAVAESACLYAQAQGGHLRELAYAGDGVNGRLYNTNDISILAPHLFDTYALTDLAYSRTPECPTCWVVRNDGVLLGLTYVPGQNVRAWHQHTTDGAFESVCCVTEGTEDALYVVVRRTINGQTVRYVERLHERRFTEQADAFFVDSGLTYDGAATGTVTGLHHLEGETVNVLADGATFIGLTVEDGAIELPEDITASVLHVGLPYTATLKTLPLSWQADGFGQGIQKNVNKAWLRLASSSGVKIGPADGTLREIKQRTNEPYGSPPALMNGWRDIVIDPDWNKDGAVEIEQTGPLPVTVLALVLDVTSGGG